MSVERRGGLTSHLWKLRVDPVQTVKTVIAVLRGRVYPAWCRARGVRFSAGRNLRIYGRLDVRGPGEVVVGEDVIILEHVRLWTHDRAALLRVGDRVTMGQARVGCAREVVVGDDCQLGESYIMDTDFHSTRADRHDPRAPVRVAPVHVGNNVWIGHYVGVLPGARVGDNSVVSFGSVVMREYPDNVILVGNPAKVAAPVQGAPAGPAVVPADAQGVPVAPLPAVAGRPRAVLSPK